MHKSETPNIGLKQTDKPKLKVNIMNSTIFDLASMAVLASTVVVGVVLAGFASALVVGSVLAGGYLVARG